MSEEDQKRKSFNDAHPNSLWARADPVTRKRIQRARRQAARDDRAMEDWAKAGFVSDAEDDDVDLLEEIRLDDPEEVEEA